MPDERFLIAENVAVLFQGAALLDVLDPEIYARDGRFHVRSGIGSHFRHCIEFYTVFLAGARSGRIDYGARERDIRLERQSLLVRERMIEIAETLSDLEDGAMAAAVVVRSEGAAARDIWMLSSIGRELQMLSSHTVHHFALITMLLRLEGVEPPEAFGVAPSTLEFWRSEACVR